MVSLYINLEKCQNDTNKSGFVEKIRNLEKENKKTERTIAIFLNYGIL